MDELPDNVKRIDILKIEYGKRKLCECSNPHYEIDFQNKLVYCNDCGAIVDAFEALCKLASSYSGLGDQVESLLQQKRELRNYKPWLRIIRDLESQYRGQKMLPCCPNCHKPFFLEEINTWANRQMEELRRKREHEKEQNNA